MKFKGYRVYNRYKLPLCLNQNNWRVAQKKWEILQEAATKKVEDKTKQCYGIGEVSKRKRKLTLEKKEKSLEQDTLVHDALASFGPMLVPAFAVSIFSYFPH